MVGDAASSSGLNPVTMLLQILYDTAAGMTGLVGLTPLELLMIVGAVFVVYLGFNFYRANFGDPGWSLDEDERKP